jgi:hypothetical protein
MFNVYRKMWAAVAFILCLVSVVYAYSGGSGTLPDPYQIATVLDWNDLMKTSSDWNKYFIMTDDVDLQSFAITPVGNSTTDFNGVFDGDGYVIYNAIIKMDSNSYVGLFGRVGAGGRIRNLGVEDVNMTGNSYVGGLAGYNYGDINDCYVTGMVTGKSSYVGGLTGRNSGTGTITGCYEIITVTADSSSYVGGLAGSNLGGTIQRCYAAGPVNGSSNVGGLVGRDSGTITSCYAIGAVNGSSYIGGFAGYKSGGTIATSYSTGAVAGTSNVGGLIGFMSGSTVNSSFWDVNTSGQPISAGGTGKTTAQMQDINTFLNAGWDFNTPVWKICNGTNYPKLAWQVLVGDFVCPDGVSFEDFAWLAQWWLRTDCSLNNDCDRTDIYKDGTVNLLDFAVFVENWLEGR